MDNITNLVITALILLPVSFVISSVIFVLFSIVFNKTALYRCSFPFNDYFTKHRLIILFSLIFTVLFGRCIIKEFFGVPRIDSLLEKNEYFTFSYVNAFPNSTSPENLRLKSYIHVINPTFTNNYSERQIFIERIYYPNGNYITFSYPNNKIDLNTRCYAESDFGDEFYLELVGYEAILNESVINSVYKSTW